MKWQKKGKIFTPGEQGLDWIQRRTQVPNALVFDNFVRVFFSCRGKVGNDGLDVARPAFVDFERKTFPNKIIRISEKPILDLGQLGTFDEFGIMPSLVVKIDSQYHLYYVGWKRLLSVPYDMAVGCATSQDGENFSKVGDGPVLGACISEPFLQGAVAGAVVLDSRIILFYTTGVKWLPNGDNKGEPIYKITRATTRNGIHFERDGVHCIESVIENEAQGAPTVFHLNNRWHMYFSYRHGFDFRNALRGYRMGYAYSDDLENWVRNDSQAGITISDSGFDSEMICYPHIFELDGKILMLYCGNDFGEDGFGLAELEV
jgi:predicted GH43/DUF377 family glycosyl hydrolase